jgi:hypothetical protein
MVGEKKKALKPFTKTKQNTQKAMEIVGMNISIYSKKMNGMFMMETMNLMVGCWLKTF